MTTPVSDSPAEESTEEAAETRAILGDTKPVTETGVNPVGAIGLIALFAWLWFIAGPVYFLVVLGLIFMIFLHELGHFMTARWTGMKPTEFFIGFGPTIFAFKKGEVTYGLKAIPAGAYVRIIGMNNLDPVAPEDEDRAYMNKSYPRRLLVISAGSIMHMVQAVVLFVLLFGIVGISQAIPGFDDSAWTAREVVAGSPAEAAGLEAGDRIVALDGTELGWFDMVAEIQDSAGETVTATVERGEEVFTTSITIGTGDEGQGRIGVAREFSEERQRPGVVAGLEEFGSTFKQSVLAVPRLVSPSTLGGLASSVTDPPTGDEAFSEERPISVVGAVGIAGQVSGIDWAFPLYVLALINVFIGIFNMAPILPLDGGHAAIATYERLRSFGGKRHRVDVAKLIPFTYAVVGVLAFVMLTTTFLDIVGLAT